MRRRTTIALALACLLAAPLSAEETATLRGSRASMERQNRIARSADFAFLRTAAQVLGAVAAGVLAVLEGNDDYVVDGASYPFAHAAVRTFVERLGSQYRASCGERLVVTSLTRPVREQPWNASRLSVHPAGMAVDLRVSERPSCRRWLERALLGLEANGLVDATREHAPPHYHVAVFPRPYLRFVEAAVAQEQARLAAEQARRDSVEFAQSLETSVARGAAYTRAFGGGAAAGGPSGGGARWPWLAGLGTLLPLALISLRRRSAARD